ncbi:MAG: SGNH/GDSL hydrolase family protein [Planctomycetes bacterium]|nr:SGNH/GDSL hydrolase family protein [Planctomycetota bacterium]
MVSDADQQKTGGRPSRLRRVMFHFTALIVVLSPLILIELAVRLFVAAPAPVFDDPYVSFSSISPLFVPDPTGSRYEIARERLFAFRPQSFAADKSPKTFRVFCLGGSTVQGRPYAVETSFTMWLELNLRAAGISDCEVVNCGGISYASYRLVPIMTELLDYQPDLFIVYTGHNEFLEDRTYGRVKKMPASLLRMHRALLNLRSYAVANHLLSRRRAGRADSGQPDSTEPDSAEPGRPVLPAEVQARLDFEDGLDEYHRDDLWQVRTIEHFRHNVETMVRMARAAGVPLILADPVSNLKDTLPFKSQSRGDLSDEQAQRVNALRDRANSLPWADVYGRIELLEQAVAIDDRHAGLLYSLGECYGRIGRTAEAKMWFTLAKDQDICPLRIIEPMHDVIGEMADRYSVKLVDVRAIFEQRTEGGIVGNEWLLDHVHPSITGHQIIADAIFRAMEDMDLLETGEGWQARRDELWQRHLATLDDVYYTQGRAHLKRLQNWSGGRVEVREPGSAATDPEAKRPD